MMAPRCVLLWGTHHCLLTELIHVQVTALVECGRLQPLAMPEEATGGGMSLRQVADGGLMSAELALMWRIMCTWLQVYPAAPCGYNAPFPCYRNQAAIPTQQSISIFMILHSGMVPGQEDNVARRAPAGWGPDRLHKNLTVPFPPGCGETTVWAGL